MNKNLFRMCGTVLTLEGLYIIFFFFPLIWQGFDMSRITVTGSFVVAAFLLTISGIGLLTGMKWSIVILWISLVISFFVSSIVGHSYPAYTFGNFQVWFIDLIMALFLSFECKKNKTL